MGKRDKVVWALIGLFFSLNAVLARKWNTNKDSIVVDAYYSDDEEGELHFDALEQPDNVECLTLDQEPGVCVTLRRCHPILFGDKGELRNPSLAEEYSKNVDTCQDQNSVEGPTDDEAAKPPVPVPTKSKIGDRITCCAKEKAQYTHRSSLEASDEELAMYQTTTNAVPLKENDQEVQQAEEIVVLDQEVPANVPQSPTSNSSVGSTGRPEVEEILVQVQDQQPVQEQDQNEDSVSVTNSPVSAVPVEEPEQSEPEQPQASSSSPVLDLPANLDSAVVPLTPEEPVVVLVPVEEPALPIVEDELAKPNDSADGCPGVTVYNTWPSFRSYPFLAAIQTRSNSGPICSGSLIDSRHVLTAAHCLHRFNSKDVARMQVRIGFTKNPENDTFNDFYQERKASKIIFHKRFHEQSKMDNNIALVQLDQPIEFDEHVAPISIFSGARGLDQGQCAGVEAGWIKYGNRKVTGISGGVIQYIEPPMSDFVLREAINKIYTNVDCQTKLFSEITDDMLCAKTEMFEARGVTTDHFRGNDGGPLVIRMGNSVQQIGIKSWAYEGNQYPTVYTRVDKYLDWINDNLHM